MRNVINFGLLFAFALLAVTGVLEYARAFSLTTARIHILAGFAVIMLVVMHVVGRVRYFRQQVQGKSSSAISRPALLATAGLTIALLVTAWKDWPPATWLVDWGYESRHSAEIVRSSSLVGFEDLSDHKRLIVRNPEDASLRQLSIYLGFRESLSEMPAVAVWAETTAGSLIETLHLERELAFSDEPTWHAALTRRSHILPIWRNRYTAVSGIGPDGQVDAVSGATDTHSFELDRYLERGVGNRFIVYVEINQPFDTDERWPDTPLGQPSVLYSVVVDVDSDDEYRLFELTGHGGRAENNGNIQYDLDELTTAKQLADLFLLKLARPPE